MAADEKLANVKKATAILFACLVDAVGDDETKARFLKNVADSYNKIRNDTDDLNALELLNWTRSMITGFDHVSGQQRPFLDDAR